MITGGFSYLAVIVFLAGAVAWAERKGSSAFFRYLPAVVLIYLGTMLLAAASLWGKTGEITTCYRVAKTHLLPLLIYLMLLRCDLRSILRLGPRMLVGFFTASLSIVLGFVVVFAAFKGLYEPDAWKSFAALSGLNNLILDLAPGLELHSLVPFNSEDNQQRLFVAGLRIGFS